MHLVLEGFGKEVENVNLTDVRRKLIFKIHSLPLSNRSAKFILLFKWLTGILPVFGLLGACSKQINPQEDRFSVHKVYIKGVKSLRESDLRKKILLENESINPFKRTPNYMDHPFMIEKDEERIVAYYRDHGYHNTKVQSETKPYKNEKKVVDVYFAVDEGKPVKITTVQIDWKESQVSPAEKEQLERRIVLKEGQILTKEAYDAQKGRLETWLKNRSYAFAKVDLSVEVNRDDFSAKILFAVDADQKIKLGTITATGGDHVKPDELVKHSALVSGQPFRPADLDFAQSKLSNTGAFASIQTKVIPNPNNPAVGDVEIAVQEGKPHEIQTAIGLGIDPFRTQIYGKLGYTHRNFLGKLRTLQTNFLTGWAAFPAFWSSDIRKQGPVLELSGQLTQPDLLGRNSALVFKAGYRMGVESFYQFHGPGFDIGVQKSFWRQLIQLSGGYHFQFLDFFNADDSVSILQNPQQAGALFGYVDPYRLAYLYQEFTVDWYNRPGKPSRGILFKLPIEEGGVYTGSAFNYQRLVPEVRASWSVGRFTFAGRAMFGQIFSQDADVSSPITQRFYLGGPNSHRGFGYNRLSYQVIGMQDNATLRTPIGGDQMFLAQMEIRVNLFKLFKNWFSFAVFADGGDVSLPGRVSLPKCTDGSMSNCPPNYLGKIDFGQLHWAVGGGLRYQTPIGAIRVDIGVRLNRLNEMEQISGQPVNNPDPGSRVAFHISLGEAF